MESGTQGKKQLVTQWVCNTDKPQGLYPSCFGEVEAISQQTPLCLSDQPNSPLMVLCLYFITLPSSQMEE